MILKHKIIEGLMMVMSTWDKKVKISDLTGKVICKISGLKKESEEVIITTECGRKYIFMHEQDCCERVDLNDFDGDQSVLVGAEILSAEEVSNEDRGSPGEHSDSFTWTFYKIETTKGGLWMRWLGESNGYYSESVDLIWQNKDDFIKAQNAGGVEVDYS